MKAGYKMTELGELPEEWDISALGEVGTFYKGKGISKSELSETGIPCVRYGEIYTKHDFVIKKFHSFVSREIADKSFRIEKGDLLFAGSGETIDDIGKAVLFNHTIEAFAGGDIIILRIEDGFPLYLTYVWNLRGVDIQRRKLGQGSSVIHIYSKGIASVKIPLPPLPEQEKIARILSTVDRKIEAIGAQIEQARVLKKGLLQRLLTRGIGHTRFKETALGEVPEAWEVVELSSFAKCFVGIASSATHAYTDHGVLLIRNQNIKSGKIVLDDILMVDKEYEIQHKSKRLRAGDILTVRTGYPGISAVVPPELENCQSFTTLIVRRFKEIITSDFLCYYINSDLGKSFFASGQAGGAQKNIGAKVLQKMKIIIPPLPEQEKIAQILSTADEKIDMLQAKQAAYRELKKGLMQQLLTGKIRVSPSP
ncbi:MAG: restriction endonuclease subunit S [Bacteroidota bacterium]